MNTTPGRREFRCPSCQLPVTYDPENPMHYASGAMLRKKDDSGPSVVYLTCPNRHIHRYQVRDT